MIFGFSAGAVILGHLGSRMLCFRRFLGGLLFRLLFRGGVPSSVWRVVGSTDSGV